MIKKFLSYYKKYIGLFIFDMSAAVIIAICNLFYPTVVKDIINKYVYDETPRMLITWSAVLLGIYILKAACTFVVSYHGHIMGVRMQKDMRGDLFNKYQALPVKFYDDNKTGDLLTRLVNDPRKSFPCHSYVCGRIRYACNHKPLSHAYSNCNHPVYSYIYKSLPRGDENLLKKLPQANCGYKFNS